MEYIAHSAKDGRPAQSYASHIHGVCSKACRDAREAEQYATLSSNPLSRNVYLSALWHDLGKLDKENQAVLRGQSPQLLHLPHNHVDAGSVALLEKGEVYGALAVYAHHRGLPDMAKEEIREDAFFRDEKPAERRRTDANLKEMMERHRESVPDPVFPEQMPYDGDSSVFFRMLLSCLADGDHTDTAAFYGQTTAEEVAPPLRARERLDQLNRYVAALGNADERSQLRQKMYLACRDATPSGSFTVCDSPVGSGKTTAIMAHLLRQAQLRKARRVFVVLPYTSIIQQSVEVYRKALVLPGEDPESVVAELHCRAEFQSETTRYLTALWQAPIVVTTAVTFFETLASCRPSTLRRLHELPGSVIFLDESHNALPLKLLPLAWKWMNVLAQEWSCYWVLASGSLVRFWELDALHLFSPTQPQVGDLVAAPLKNQLMEYERNRVGFLWNPVPQSRSELVAWVESFPGPRLMIVNTVKTAAAIAAELFHRSGRECVEHLSTALTPEDREATIRRIRSRLKDEKDTNWTLVATSCVEAGVDFSFRTGFRELASLLSLLQAAGRVNRHGTYAEAQMWSFTLQDDARFENNPALENSRKVLEKYLRAGAGISPALSTQSLQDELICDDSSLPFIKRMMEEEACMQFKTVDEEFSVIDNNTVLAVVDQTLADTVKAGKGTWRQLQRKSVSIRRGQIHQWELKEIAPEVYQWTLPYDGFLGYMQGVLNKK